MGGTAGSPHEPPSHRSHAISRDVAPAGKARLRRGVSRLRSPDISEAPVSRPIAFRPFPGDERPLPPDGHDHRFEPVPGGATLMRDRFEFANLPPPVDRLVLARTCGGSSSSGTSSSDAPR